MQKKSYKKISTSLKGQIRVFKEIPKSTSFLNLLTVIRDSFRFGKTYRSVLKVELGEIAPKFELPNALNQIISLDEILKKKKVVIIFYRGGWCPFCNLQLRVYQDYINEFEQAGATLVAISPQIPDQSLSTKEKQELKFEVLTDIENKVARKYTTILNYSDKSTKALKGVGINFDEYYENGLGEVPIPAVFAINQNGKIIFAESKGGDHKKRVEPTDILLALKNERKTTNRQ